MTISMNGKVCMITGATAGIGAVAARELARLGATLVLVSRSPQKCADTVASIKEETGNQNVDYLAADLSSMEAVCGVAYKFREKHTRLDVLVNNAGSFFLTRQLSADGNELTFALNHLNYFLLTLLLLEPIKVAAPSRIVNISSNSHQGHSLDFDNLQGEKGYKPMKAYARSKLANVLFTYELARRLDGTGVTVNALNPGFVATDIWYLDNKWLRRFLEPYIRWKAITPQESAQFILYLATSPELDGVSGGYFSRGKPAKSAPDSYNEATARRLWDISEGLVGRWLASDRSK
jgi:NAD(P)-dependent dehydrogenase (short-subunit alcohol dehydrogenase family)